MINNKKNSHFGFNSIGILANSKNSQSHVEIMISFVIFIGFLLFIFIFMNPFARTKEPSYIMDNIQKAIISNISSTIGRLSVVTNGSSCYNKSKFDQYLKTGEKIRVVQENEKRYIVYYGEFFEEDNPDCNLPMNYTLGAYSREDVIVFEKILDLNESYNLNYDNLKKSLGITNDFLFSVQDLVGNERVSVSRNIPTRIDVEAREIPIRVINSQGQIQELILKIKVW